MIEIEKIDFSYAGKRRMGFGKSGAGADGRGGKVFDNFSLTLSENNIYGLLGKNGTGKSTLLYLISGLLHPKKGSIKLDGVETRLRRPETLSEIFIVPEEYDLPQMSLKSYVKLNRMFYPRFSDEVMRKCLDEFELPGDLNLKALSMGQKKKVYMCMALATGTKILLMDEPTNGLDIPSKSLFRKVVANNMSEDRMLIISTHQVHDVESLLDHILILDNTRILMNSSTEEIMEKYTFGLRDPQDGDGMIYAEPTLQGNMAISRRREGDPETQINLELLFNAVTKKLINND